MCFTTYVHDRYMDEYDKMMMEEEIVTKEQERRKQSALKKLEAVVSPNLVEYFGKILINAYMEGSNDADIIIDACKLDKTDLRALRDEDLYIYSELKQTQSHEEAYDRYEECFG